MNILLRLLSIFFEFDTEFFGIKKIYKRRKIEMRFIL